MIHGTVWFPRKAISPRNSRRGTMHGRGVCIEQMEPNRLDFPRGAGTRFFPWTHICKVGVGRGLRGGFHKNVCTGGGALAVICH